MKNINKNLILETQDNSNLNLNKNNNKNKNKKKTAFSLIELSIVLIIIGLLVAGITGGASLIKSAKMRSFMNEVTNYKRAYNAYYAATGTMLGGGNIKLSSVGYGYNVDNPFYHLYEEGITDFKTEETGECEVSLDFPTCGPKINSLGSGIFAFSNHKDIKGGSSTNLAALYIFPVKDAENIDKKYDDGIGTSGSIYCSSNKLTDLSYYHYDEHIKDYNTPNCGSLIFTLDI